MNYERERVKRIPIRGKINSLFFKFYYTLHQLHQMTMKIISAKRTDLSLPLFSTNQKSKK